MPKFDRYFLSQLLVLFGFFALVLVSVYWLNQAVRLFDQLIGDGQSAVVFLQFTALTLPNVIRVVLPIAAFAATLQCVNRLMSESELVVAQTMGFSALRLARPVVVMGSFVAVLVLILANLLVPLAERQLVDRKAEIAGNVTSQLLSEGRFLHPAEGITFYIGEITPQGELKDIFLEDARTAERRTTYSAARALLVASSTGPKLLMFEGMAQDLSQPDSRLSVTHFSESVFDIGGLISPPKARVPKIAELSTVQLITAAPELVKTVGSHKAAFQLEGHDRIAQALLAIAACLIGFATLMLGAFSRHGVWRQIIVAIGLVIVLKLVYNVMAEQALQNVGYWPGVYLPGIGGSALALLLLWISDTPGMMRKRRSTEARG